MKSVIFLASALVITCSVHSQLSRDNRQTPPIDFKSVEFSDADLGLSDTLTPAALARFLTSPPIPRSQAIRRAAGLGSRLLPVVIELIDSALVTPTEFTLSPALSNPQIPDLVQLIAEIGTPEAMSYLAHSAVTGSSAFLRGASLHELAQNQWRLACDTLTSPSPDIIEPFILGLSDRRMSGIQQTTISDLAQMGLLHWTGFDFGDPMFAEMRLARGYDGEEASAAEYALVWWQQNHTRLVWNQTTCHFEIR